MGLAKNSENHTKQAPGGAYTSPIMGYHHKNGNIHAGMIRVIFELGQVKQADGKYATLLSYPLNTRGENVEFAPVFA